MKVSARHLMRKPVAGALALLSCVLISTASTTRAGNPPNPGGLAPYRGLGSWVDIYDTAQFDHPRATVERMKRKGVRTLFVETGNYSTGPIYRPAAQARLIHAAHARGMRVIAWYLPSFTDPEVDFDRAMASIRFRTNRGQRFDGFGLDIEADLVDDVSLRIQRMLALSRRIRSAVGNSYSLGAIVPSPYGMQRVPDYWGPVRDFPWAQLAGIYDVIVPMSYFSFRVEGMRGVYKYNAFNVRLIRQESHDPEVPIHLIGGIAGESTPREVRGFVRAVRTFGLPGGSLYAYDSTGRQQWRELRKIPVNPRQSPPLPIPLGRTGSPDELGNIPGSDRSHPKEVFFRIGPRSKAVLLEFEAFDIASGEVHVEANWRGVAGVPVSPVGAWGPPSIVRVPAYRLSDKHSNVISFVARGDHPNWSVWGVRKVRVAGT
jgi:hypothetical protein